MNERVIVLDFESEHLVFKTPHGDVTKRFSFLSVNGTRRAGFASCFIDFDMLNQNAYKITFKSPEERQEFEEAVSALISHHPVTAGYLQHGSSADLFTEQANEDMGLCLRPPWMLLSFLFSLSFLFLLVRVALQLRSLRFHSPLSCRITVFLMQTKV